MLQTLQPALPPGDHHAVPVLHGRNLSNFILHQLLQWLQSSVMVSPEIVLQACIEEKIIGGEVRGVCWMRDPCPTQVSDQLQ